MSTKTQSRCVKAVHCEGEDIEFLVGAHNISNAWVIKAKFDIEKNELMHEEFVNFQNLTQNDEVINDVTDLYSINKDSFLVQCFNQTKKKHQLKLFSNIDDELNLNHLPELDRDSVFDVKISKSELNELFVVESNKLSKYDIEAKTIKSELMFSEEERKYLKICSDINKIYTEQVAVGAGKSLYLIDSQSNEVTGTIKNAHYNGILSCDFDPQRSYIVSTSGMDYSVKFWDLRKADSPVGGIYNNSHWIWCSKFNQTYSRAMITCSSSSIVRAIVMGKESEVDEDNQGSNKYEFLQEFSLVDYIEFEDSVYSVDWANNDPWLFAAVSFNSYLHINTIPEEIKYKIMLDN